MKKLLKKRITVFFITFIILGAMLSVNVFAATSYNGKVLAAVNTNLSTSNQENGSFSDITNEKAEEYDVYLPTKEQMQGVIDIYTDSETGKELRIIDKDFPNIPIEIIHENEQKLKSVDSLSESYTTESTKTFTEDNGSTHTMKCLYIGKYCTVWGCTSDSTYSSDLVLSTENAKVIGDKYDEYAPEAIDSFGSWYDADGDGKLAIYCFDIDQTYQNTTSSDFSGSYVAGYFWPVMLADSNGSINGKVRYLNTSYAIHTDCICLDTFPAMGSKKSELFSNITDHLSTLVHENQHLINFSYSISDSASSYYDNMETYLNEGFSMAAEHMICGSNSTHSRINYFNSSSYETGHSLTYWNDNNNVLSNYTNSYLFAQYLRTRYASLKNDPKDPEGNSIFRYVMEQRQSETGSRGTLNIIADLLHTTPKQLILDFWAAIYLKNPTGWYGFNGESWANDITPVMSGSSTKNKIYSGGVRYYSLESTSMNVSSKSNITMLQFNNDGSVSIDGVPQWRNLKVKRAGEDKITLSFSSNIPGTIHYAPTAGIANDIKMLSLSKDFVSGNNIISLDISGKTDDTPTISYYLEGSEFLGEINTLMIPEINYSVTVVPPEHGSITLSANDKPLADDAEIEKGTVVTVNAITDENYVLRNIYLDGEVLSGNTFTVTGAHTVSADIFDPYICGDNARWELKNNKLIISGSGTMTDFTTNNRPGWYEQRNNIKSVEISSDITNIGNYAFTDCTALTKAILPEGITTVGSYAFCNCPALTQVSIPSSVTEIKDYAFKDDTEIKYIAFHGSLPKRGTSAIPSLNATAYYPSGDLSWLWIIRMSVGKNCTWISVTDHSKHVILESQVTSPAKCEKNGEKLDLCSCGNTIINTIDALGHDYIPHPGQAATCTENGWEAYNTCSRCDYTSYKTINALQHSYDTPTYTWTDEDNERYCTAKHICTHDKNHIESEKVKASYSVTTPATLLSDGTGTYTATFTNETFATQTDTKSISAVAIDETTGTLSIALDNVEIDKLASSVESGCINMDFSKYTGIKNISLPDNLINNLCANPEIEKVNIITDCFELTLPYSTLEAIESELDNGIVQLSLCLDASTSLTEKENNLLKSLNNVGTIIQVLRIEVMIKNENEVTKVLNDLSGSAEIKFTHTFSSLESGFNLSTFCISENGTLSPAELTYENGYVSLIGEDYSDIVILASKKSVKQIGSLLCIFDETARTIDFIGSKSMQTLFLTYYKAERMISVDILKSIETINLNKDADTVKIFAMSEADRPLSTFIVFNLN